MVSSQNTCELPQQTSPDSRRAWILATVLPQPGIRVVQRRVD
jgi:hypothetical protein